MFKFTISKGKQHTKFSLYNRFKYMLAIIVFDLTIALLFIYLQPRQITVFLQIIELFYQKQQQLKLSYYHKQMLIINYRPILSSLCASHHLYRFSSASKKSNPAFQLLRKQQHQQDAKYLGLTKSSHIETWKINQINQSQGFDVKKNQAQYLGLRHLQQAFKSKLTQVELTKTVVQSANLPDKTKKGNSQTFIQMIGHTLGREGKGCTQIINLIQAYCEEIRCSSQQKMDLINSSYRNSDSSKKSLGALFVKIRSILMDEMVLDQKTRQKNTKDVDDLINMLAKADLNSITLKEFEMNGGSLDSYDNNPKEIRSFLNFEIMKKASTFQRPLLSHQQKKSQVKQAETDNILQQALKLKQNKKSSIIYVKGQHQQGIPKKLEVKVQSEQDIFFINSIEPGKNYDKEVMQSKKYAYLYFLPYNILESQCKEFIAHIERTKGIKVISYTLLPYGKYLSVTQMTEPVHKVPEYFQVEGFIQRTYAKVDVNMYLNADKNSKNSKGKSKEKPIALSSSTQALLKKIKHEKYSQFLNHSVLILKFESEQQKKKLVTPELRLYGLNFKRLKNIRIQQGFSKTVLKILGIPPGCTTTELNHFFNGVLKPLGFRLQVEKDLYLSKYYTSIQFQHFTQVLSAMKLFQNQFFREKQLKAEICYGPSKVYKGNYSISPKNEREKLKQRVVEVSKKYYEKHEAETQS